MKNKKIVYTIIGVVSVVLIALAITYAYWQLTKTQEGVNEISSACLDINLVDAESGNTGVTLQDQYPLSDTEGASLKPYKFTVTNNCDTRVLYQIALESIGDSTSALKATSLKVMLDDKTSLLSSNKTVTPTVSGAYASHKLGMGSLAATGESGSSVTHELRLWIDEDAPVSEANKTFTGKISVTIGQGIENNQEGIKEGSLAYTLVEAAGGISSITELDSSAFATATTASESGMYKASDGYGTSYYYRGNVTNNYVKFGSYADDVTEVRGYYSTTSTYFKVYESMEACTQATSYNKNCTDMAGKDMYWRIVRINGDGTIRMIYAGSEKYENGDYRSDSYIEYYTFYNENTEDKMYVGYMYGTEEDPYGDDPDTPLTDSTLKDILDSWYEANLKENYEDYIADSIFCNDRDEYGEGEYGHLYYKTSNRLRTTYEPVLTCNMQRDRFTVDDITLGNGHLTNPVGLITADEAVMAGYAWTNDATSNYLDIQHYFWTSSPSHFIGDAYMIFVGDGAGGSLGTSDVYDDYDCAARPVINLKADVEFTIDDDGTYVITTN